MIVIIPDMHNNFVTAEAIIGRENPDDVVFLGDYFDSLDDNLQMASQTAIWLKQSMTMKNRIHLLGNHELLYRNKIFGFGGITENKYRIIKKVGVNLHALLDYCWVGEWLCTHAGLSYDFYKTYGAGKNVNEFLERYRNEEQLRKKLYICGITRGGQDPYGGIIWCDYTEFEDIYDIKQVFGHSFGDLRFSSNHVCLDSGLKYYGVFDEKNEIMQVKNTDDGKTLLEL